MVIKPRKTDIDATIKRCADWTEKASVGTGLVAFLQQDYSIATLEKAAWAAGILLAISKVLTVIERRMQ